MWERSLPGATESWCRPGEVAGGKCVCTVAASTEEGEKLETRIPGALGQRLTLSASNEQHCTQEIASIPNDSSFLASMTVK